MGRGFVSFWMCALLGLAAGCEREARDYAAPPPASLAAAGHDTRDAYDIAQGEQLYHWMNCSGCHFNGGGGIGPALDDNAWRYGGSLQQIHDSIAQGRPNGMPTWRNLLTDQQTWQIAAYVRSMPRYVSKDVAPSRRDAIPSGPSENRRIRTPPPWGAG